MRLGVGVPLYGNASQTIHTVPAGLVLQLRRLFKRLGVDVVHLHAPYNPSMCAIAPLAIPDAARSASRPTTPSSRPGVLLDVFAPDPAALARPARRARRRLRGLHRLARARTSRYDYRIIPNGIDDRHFSPDAEPLPELREGGKPLILFLGRFDPRNGLPTMLEAFQQVHAEHEGSVRLCIVGDGPLGNVYRRKLPERVAGDVIWAGRVDWSRPRYYASADIHCTPCQRASFGMVLLEAMSTGRPVVASRISGFQLLMEHGKQGLMVSPADDANRFAQALLYLLDRPAERARMGREGRITAVTRYAWSSVAVQLEQLYDELLDAQAGLGDEEARGRPALRRRLGRDDRRRRGARRGRRHGARGLGRLGVLRARLPARPDLGLGLVHAQLAALRQGA